MLSNQQRALVKATVPALQAHGETITRRFYRAMLTAHPELNNYFNPANQLGEGGQARALAASVLSYAQNIDRLETLDVMVGRIAERHVSLEIRPEHYPIVGEYLLRAIADVLKDAATPTILDAWAAAYGQLANVMIGREAALRKVACEQPGAWVGFKAFRVVHKVTESQVMTSFILEPEDGKPLPQFKPGQYVSIKVRPPGAAFDQIRQYSLSATPNGHQFRISVTREGAPAGSSDIRPGTVSTFLHRFVREGDTLLLHMPGGDNVLDEGSTSPVVLMSGGAGITAVLGMLEYLAKVTDRQVLWLHAVRSRQSDSFAAAVRVLAASRSGIKCVTLYETIGPGDVKGRDFDVAGRITSEVLRAHLPAGNAEFYYCGPIGFMVAIEHILDELGVAAQRRHSEAFAPEESFAIRSASSDQKNAIDISRTSVGSRS